MKEISSPSNQKLAWLASLHKSSQRRALGVFVVEGAKEIEFALKAGLTPHSVFVHNDLPSQNILQQFPIDEQFSLSSKAFARVAYRYKATDNLLAVFQTPSQELGSIKLSQNPFVIIVESVEKPGNLGAILRVADGAGANAVIVADEATDIYNPNVIRSSVGCIFTSPIATSTNTEILEFCHANKLSLFAAALSDKAAAYETADFTGPTAIVLGTESAGLSDFWLNNAEPVRIPMLGHNDSLNVAAATAVMAYEVVRQRHGA